MKPAEQLHNRVLEHVIITGRRILAGDHDVIPAFFNLLCMMPENLPDPSLKKMSLYAVAVLFADGDAKTCILQTIIHHVKHQSAVCDGSSPAVDRSEILILFQ